MVRGESEDHLGERCIIEGRNENWSKHRTALGAREKKSAGHVASERVHCANLLGFKSQPKQTHIALGQRIDTSSRSLRTG